MSTVYSRRFFLGAVSTSQTLFTVPLGHVYVVRDVTGILGAAAGAQSVYLEANNIAIAFWTTPASQNTNVHWDGRMVLVGGEAMEYVPQNPGVTANLFISGYDFLA